MNIKIQPKELNDITILEMFRDDEILKKPMILSYHGWTARKEDMLTMAYELAVEGFFVVCPDAYMHGQRKLLEGNHDLNLFFDIIENTANEIDQIIDSYKDNDLADSSKVGLTGVSMGGCIVFSYLVKACKRIKAAVSVVSTPDWLSIVNSLENLRAKIKDERYIPPSFVGDMDRLAETAKAIQPANKSLELFDIPLLMLNGELDELIPINRVHAFCDKFNTHDVKENKIKLITYPGVGHAGTVEMIKETAGWFEIHL